LDTENRRILAGSMPCLSTTGGSISVQEDVLKFATTCLHACPTSSQTRF
jgi:hypothetical protein